MEEEIDLKKFIKEEVLEVKDVDLGIFEAYNQMPEAFRKSLSFEKYYEFHREKIEEDKKQRIDRETIESLSEKVDKPEEKIPDEDLCKQCKKERKLFNNYGYCAKCGEKFREKAKNTEKEIRKQLLDNLDFLKLTSETAAIAFVKKEYSSEKTNNEFIPLNTIAKETYQLKKMQ
ncbi:MAG: hypothetical protein DRN66_04190 [Candidatus Nanohalarchaeota archaeon]|nr:MAG: hypothetical protein DRN66_04190 [Candidatus Nanohaloarchaeota archaeon]